MSALTIELDGTGDGSDGRGGRTISRTADRVHIAASAQREWLYTRNVRDPRRVAADMIDHGQRLIVHYEESDLRSALGIRGWLDVLTLGFDVETLPHMTAVDDSRLCDGFGFARYDLVGDRATTRVWWNERELLPLEVLTTTASGEQRATSVRTIRPGVGNELLESPGRRFPDYRQVDYSDWLEGLH